MRHSRALKGLRSTFSRIARRVKTFFGWLEGSEGIEEKAIRMVSDRPEPESESIKKPKNDDDNDGGGSDAIPSFRQGQKNDIIENGEEKTKPKTGYDMNGRPINYAKPLGMSDEEWELKVKNARIRQRQKKTDKSRKENIQHANKQVCADQELPKKRQQTPQTIKTRNRQEAEARLRVLLEGISEDASATEKDWGLG